MPKRKKPEAEKEKKLSSYTLKLSNEQIAKIKDYCDYHLWEFFAVNYAHYGYRNKQKKVTIVAYESGKFVISGKGTEAFVQDYIEAEITGEPRLGYDEVHHPEWFEPHAGLDEAGKGDLFGPVITATVIATEPAIRALIKAGVKDSKTMRESSILRLEKIIRETRGVVVQTAYCRMPRYNELMAKPRANLNRLLAWLHARALQGALKKSSVPWGLLDQFSKQPLVQQQLKKDGTDFDLRMRTKAESDPVVAAASICARAEFVRNMESLSAIYGEPLPKGAGVEAKKAAEKLVAKLGPEALGDFAKLHFKTAKEVLGLSLD